VLLGIAFAGLYLRWRGILFRARWYHYACVTCTPLGFIATLAGWTVTEVGRQPFVVYGLLRTADAVSPIAGSAIFGSLAVALVLYNLLLLSFLFYGGRLVWHGFGSQTPISPIAAPAGVVGKAPAVRKTINERVG
jgi:cytochrome d ubiquinol oxidase subunit I